MLHTDRNMKVSGKKANVRQYSELCYQNEQLTLQIDVVFVCDGKYVVTFIGFDGFDQITTRIFEVDFDAEFEESNMDKL